MTYIMNFLWGAVLSVVSILLMSLFLLTGTLFYVLGHGLYLKYRYGNNQESLAIPLKEDSVTKDTP